MRRLSPHWLIAIAALALLLRSGWVEANVWKHGGGTFYFDDERVHWQLAANLMTRGAFVTDNGLHAPRMPAYPLFLAPFAWAGAAGMLAARHAQAILGTLTALTAARFATAAAGPRCGVAAGLLVAGDVYGVFFANLLLTEVLFTLAAVMLTFAAWRLVAAARLQETLWPHALGVAAWGVLALMCRPSAALWLPALWFVTWWCAERSPRLVLPLALSPVLLVAALLPWGLRNHSVLGGYAWLSANGGITLYDALGPQADGSSNQEFLQHMPDLAALSELERDARLRALAVAEVRSNPVRALELAGWKLLRTWNPFPNVAEHSNAPEGWVGAGYTLVVVGGALAALLLTGRRPRTSAETPAEVECGSSGWPAQFTLHLLVWLPTVYFTLLHCVYIGSVRYRVPLMPLLAIAGALAIGRLLPQWVNRHAALAGGPGDRPSESSRPRWPGV